MYLCFSALIYVLLLNSAGVVVALSLFHNDCTVDRIEKTMTCGDKSLGVFLSMRSQDSSGFGYQLLKLNFKTTPSLDLAKLSMDETTPNHKTNNFS